LEDDNYGDLKELQRKTRDQALRDQALTDEWIGAIKGQAEKLILISNNENNKEAEAEGLWYLANTCSNAFGGGLRSDAW
jgi:hypothetical protein